MLSTEWFSLFAPLGSRREGNEWEVFGAGVFLHKPPLLWLVTANHIVEMVEPVKIVVLVNRSSRGGLAVLEVGKALAARGLSWLRDTENDIATAPVPVSPEFKYRAIMVEDCLPLQEVVPSMPCFTIGYPYGSHGVDPNRVPPLVLDGVISG